jgi:hypothetical protein
MDRDAGTIFCSDNKNDAPDSPEKLPVKVSVTSRPSLREMVAEAPGFGAAAALEVKYTAALEDVAGTTNTVPLSMVIAADEEFDTVTVALAAVRGLGWYPIIRAKARTEALWVAVSK